MDRMQNPGEALLAELATEQKELRISATLTLVTFVSLVSVGLATVYDFSTPVIWIGFLVAYLAGGLPAAYSALQHLMYGRLDIDLLMVLAACAAAGVGEVRDGAILLLLFSLAGTLEGYALGNTKRAVVALMKLRPEEAHIKLADGQLLRVKVEALKIGQTVLVKAGERIPVDGVVKTGVSAVDQSPVTGESVPVDKIVGEKVFAGSVNGYGVLTVTVETLASQSTLARMITLVTSAQAERSPSERFSEWFGSRYTIVVLVGSIGALAIFIGLDFSYAEAFYKAATLLVVASPCAIVISVPAAVLSALANAARRGMLFKGGAALEELGAIDIIAFDKTGTLTRGQMQVTDVVSFTHEQSKLLEIAASLEAHSEHPLATSILQYAVTKGVTVQEVTETDIFPGKGLSATIAGVVYWAGNRRLLAQSTSQVNQLVHTTVTALESTGKTVVLIGRGTVVLGCIALADTVRESASEAIATLRSAGIKRIVMLTGDHSTVAHAIGSTIGIAPHDIYAELLPEDKVAIIKTLRTEGTVAFVGDGVNDAAALATAQVGIAMGVGGSDVALEAADVALLSDDLRKIVVAFRLAKQTDFVIKQNLLFAILILLLMVIVTTFWYLPLPLGVIGHEGGTLLVVANGLRLLVWGRG
jgi:heavy metal translocating P-type ATPase